MVLTACEEQNINTVEPLIKDTFGTKVVLFQRRFSTGVYTRVL